MRRGHGLPPITSTYLRPVLRFPFFFLRLRVSNWHVVDARTLCGRFVEFGHATGHDTAVNGGNMRADMVSWW